MTTSQDLGLAEIVTSTQHVVHAQLYLRDNFAQKTANEPELWAIDLVLTQPLKYNLLRYHIDLSNHLNDAWAQFLVSAVEDLSKNEPSISLRFLFSKTTGQIIRNDLFERRFECCNLVTSARTFLSPLQNATATLQPKTITSIPASSSEKQDGASLLGSAIGGIRLQVTPFADLDAEQFNRLGGFSWLLSSEEAPLVPKRIAWVQGREDIDCIERALRAAAALGIHLVVFDEPGHWLQDPNSPWAHLREDFVEVDIAPNDGFPDRVVAAVRAYPKPIDGIVTISDVRLAGVAAACKILGLPSESPIAYEIAADKGRTRLLETVGAEESFVLSSTDELDGYLSSRTSPLTFPLVVKPVIGWSSDCVTKVRDLNELQLAVRKASDRHADSPKPSTAVVVEPYVAGPEVDANFVMLDGEILFADINDDFPSPADSSSATAKANFQETQNVIPSALPAEELQAIQDQLRTSLLRQGFSSGIFHCEARVRNSSVRYAPVSPSGVLDLVSASASADSQDHPKEIEVYLHEINARPPGYLESVAVLLAHGIDYYALRMLLAIGDPASLQRFRALSVSFLNGSQFHLSVMIIQQTRRGIMKSRDAAQEFLEKHPDIKANVVDYYTRKKGGDILEGPDAASLWWIAFFSVISRTSRRDLLERVAFIEKEFDYEFDPLP
ncbi:hypothetical protein QBC38DRAFT_492543 [Podospora fimiseda]|uniref:ATP-grasp domain-containing protein n=1 Tax=Podospora fimiseda TaxID=252190 RepID=A0AAN6YM01_9PEZI|nr:hypothetical protein QBC38DRAFT_492543 [Podospora fimiseda]